MPGVRLSRSGSDTGTSVHSPDRKGAPPHKPFGGRVRNPFCEGPSIPPVKVYVVDNGGQWTHREWRVLKYLGVETKIVPNDTPYDALRDVDGLVLSGGAASVGIDASKMGRTGGYIVHADFPILGICAGHQFMAMHLGGEARPAELPEFGKTRLVVERTDMLFDGLPQTFEVWENHNDEVTALPKGFVTPARSAT